MKKLVCHQKQYNIIIFNHLREHSIVCGEWVAVSSPVMFSPGFSAVYTLCLFSAFASQTVVIIRPRRIQLNCRFCCIIQIYTSEINKCLSRWNQWIRVRQECSLDMRTVSHQAKHE